MKTVISSFGGDPSKVKTLYDGYYFLRNICDQQMLKIRHKEIEQLYKQTSASRNKNLRLLGEALIYQETGSSRIHCVHLSAFLEKIDVDDDSLVDCDEDLQILNKVRQYLQYECKYKFKNHEMKGINHDSNVYAELV